MVFIPLYSVVQWNFHFRHCEVYILIEGCNYKTGGLNE